ncbi:MAG: lysylphosphatidylglycerol synthase transmembrane domain-containing protein [Anaerolineales bacterium]
MTSHRRSLSTWVRWLGTLLSLGLFLWLITRLNWSVISSQLAELPLWTVLLALLFYLVSQAFNTLRWCALLWAHDVNITFWQAFRITWSGIFASNFLPSTIGGDGLRMAAVYPYARSKTVAFGSVALDRLINMAAMACLVPLPLFLFGARLSVLLAVALPFNLRALAEKYFPKIVAALREWASRPQAFLWAFLAAWPSNLTAMFSTWLIAYGLGMDVSFWQVAAVQTVTYFFAVLPISVNGYGVREVTYATLFVALGASLEQASALAVITRFLIVLVTIPGAIWVSRIAVEVIEA